MTQQRLCNAQQCRSAKVIVLGRHHSLIIPDFNGLDS